MITGILLMAFLSCVDCFAVPAPQAMFGWEPASGPVAGYLVKLTLEGENDILIGSVSEPRVAIPECDEGRLADLQAFRIIVRAIDSFGNMGPMSEASELTLCASFNPDFNGDTLVNGLDFAMFLELWGVRVVDQGL